MNSFREGLGWVTTSQPRVSKEHSTSILSINSNYPGGLLMVFLIECQFQMNRSKYFFTVREYARLHRRNPTPAEEIAWEKLRKRRFRNKRFLRQKVICVHLEQDTPVYFIADFYCAEHKLILEVDGPIHSFQRKDDDLRDSLILARGYCVVRVTNSQVENEWELVERKINAAIEDPPQPLPNP